MTLDTDAGFFLWRATPQKGYDTLVPGAPGFAEADSARAALTAADDLARRASVLSSEETAEARAALLRDAITFALRAHLAAMGGSVPRPDRSIAEMLEEVTAQADSSSLVRGTDEGLAALLDSPSDTTAPTLARLSEGAWRLIAPLEPPDLRRGRLQAERVARVALVVIAAGLLALAVAYLVYRRPGPNLALRAAVKTSSAEPGHAGTSGLTDGLREGYGFHTTEEASPWAQVDLGGVKSIKLIVVTNRQDCCGERAVPLAVEVSTDEKTWTRVGLRTAEFSTWDIALPKPTDVRYVRAIAQRRTTLHLAEMEVY